MKRAVVVLAVGALLTATPASAVTEHRPASSSSATDMTVDPPQIRWAGWHHHHHTYVIVATWEWRNDHYADDAGGRGGINSNLKLGGSDGFAIRLNSNLAMISYGLGMCGNPKRRAYRCRTYTQPSYADEYGAGYQKQDRMTYKQDTSSGNWPPDYWSDDNMYVGTEWIYFRARSGCVRGVQGFATYAHTWDSTAVDGISIGANSIGFSWSHEGHQWTAGSQPSNTRKVCS